MSITVDSGRIRRTLHVQLGELIGADSDVLTERLGVLLVADGKLDVSLVEPLVEAARAAGRYFGDQVVAEKLLTGGEIAAVLERQAQSRFDRALQMPGEVTVGPLQHVRVVIRRPLLAEIVTAFRQRLSTEVVSSLVAALPPNHPRLQEDLFAPEQLGLVGSELRYWRQLASGQDAAGVLDRATDYEVALRLMGALVGLGAIDVRMQVDPIEEALRRSA